MNMPKAKRNKKIRDRWPKDALVRLLKCMVASILDPTGLFARETAASAEECEKQFTSVKLLFEHTNNWKTWTVHAYYIKAYQVYNGPATGGAPGVKSSAQKAMTQVVDGLLKYHTEGESEAVKVCEL